MQFNFNAATVQPLVPFEPVPEGWYPIMCVKSEMKPTKDGQGHFLELEHKIQSGLHAGRSLFDRLNVNNPSQQATELAYRQLSALCHAVGVIQITDTSMLHNKPCECRVSLRAPSGEYGANNEVKGYRATGSGGALASAAAPAGGGAAFAPPSGGAPPWGGPAPAPAAAAAAGSPPPWGQPPAASAPPPVMAPTLASVVFAPPAGWVIHPDQTHPGGPWYYKGQEVKSEAELKAMAPPAAAAPAAQPPPWARTA